MKYEDRVCKKCGIIIRSNYQTCWGCNNEFWKKWYKLPKVQKVNGEFVHTEEHIKLIKEYYKEDYFGCKEDCG